MKLSVLTAFDQLYEPFFSTSLLKKAQHEGIISVNVQSYFDQVLPKERIDSPTFGPGPGMLIRPEVVQKGVESAEQAYGTAYKIFFSPHGKVLTQAMLQRLAQKAYKQGHVLFVAARYEGMDARVEEKYADEIVSIGNYVVMDGDLPAMVTIEGLLRYIPGVVGKHESVIEDSFTGPFVDFPQYTAPVCWEGITVPEIVRSGNHAAIDIWRKKQAIVRSVHMHFGWVSNSFLAKDDKRLVQAEIPSHYAALLHSNVMLPSGKEGVTSVTSFDVHDGARSSATYGIKGFSIVTPLVDQQELVQTLIDYWQNDDAVKYNPHRHEAMQAVSIKGSLQEVIDEIYKKEGKKPVVIGTSAKHPDQVQRITFYDQSHVWQKQRPVLFLFGTGSGLAAHVLTNCDYVLLPIEGFTEFNHLSVRSAMAIVYDRWLGVSPKNR